jgi:hypothetical protein
MRITCSFVLAAALGLLVACGPPADGIGIDCASAGDCEDSQMCITEVPSGYCTASCTTPGMRAECPEGAICDQVSLDSGNQNLCVLECEAQDDCREGYQCNGVTGSDVKACKPN